MKVRNYFFLWIIVLIIGIGVQTVLTGCTSNVTQSENYSHVKPGVYTASVFNSYYDDQLAGRVKVYGDFTIELKRSNESSITTNLTIDYTNVPGVRDTIPYYPISAFSEGLYEQRGDSLCSSDNLTSHFMECSHLRAIGDDYFIMEVDPEAVLITGAQYLTFNRY